jgi:hypothetical protein
VDAGDLDNSKINLDGMTVESPLAEDLGKVDGFVIDVSSGRPYYVVVDGGGWFTSKFFLLPIGHVGLASAGRSLVADISKERINRYPGFDRGAFEKLSEDELNRLDEQMVSACCPSEVVDRTAWSARWDTWAHYRAPSWWDADFYRPDRADTMARSIAGASASAVRSEPSPERELVRAHDDVSPHAGGRAQPGDVIGVETGGERTYVGDTSEDENERRRNAEKADAKHR